MKDKYSKSLKSALDPKILMTLLLIVSGWYSDITAQTITGNVFRDFNANGVKDNSATFNEVGVSGVTIKCTDAVGGTATTTSSNVAASLGDYSLSGCTGASRVEFTWTQYGDYSGPTGIGSNTSVQFINVTRTGINFGLNYPSDFIQNNPNLIVPKYRNGRISGNSDGAVVSFQNSASNTDPVTEVTPISSVGSLWGVAVQPTKKIAYMTAFLKRHVGIGPLGFGGVYLFDYSSGSAQYTNSFNLQGVTASNGGLLDFGTIDRNIPNDLGPDWVGNIDVNAFERVGKMGMGDADISEDGNTLWVVNLYQRSLISIDVTDPSTGIVGKTINQYPISLLANAPTCNNGILRPFGLEFRNGMGYVGMICTAELGGAIVDLHAYVMSFNPLNLSTGLANQIDFPLDYKRENVGGHGTPEWRPWLDTFSGSLENFNEHYAQPIISDMEIDYNGNITIGIMDRLAHQGGAANNFPVYNYGGSASENTVSTGDLVKLCRVSGSWVKEGDSGCPVNDSGLSGGLTDDGLSGHGEFYYYDAFIGNHEEVTTGALLFLPGYDQMITTVFDPLTDFYTQGLHWYNANDGSRIKALQIETNLGTKTFGKASGLGDIEVLADPAPLEIGNRVWLDTDKDGVQDAGEVGISGVQVQLLKGTTVIGTATTDANGNYYFSNAIGSSTGSAIYGITQLMPNMAYTVHFPTTTTVSGTSYNLTTANSTTGGGTDLIDSDAAATGDVSVLATDIPISGANNHTFDVGYSATTVTCTQPTFTINAVQPTCASPTGSISIGTITGPDSYTFNYDDMGTYVTGVLGANGTASNGATVASGLSAGTYTVQLFKSTDNTCISSPNQTVTLNAPTGCGGGGQPDLELTKVADKTTVVSGNTITYTITLKNVGTASATGVKVKDVIPAGLTYQSSAPSQGTYTNSIWDVGTVAVGATLTLTITVTVN